MYRYVALLRGINVGGNATIAMKDLKHAFEQASYTEVSTYINSGNVLFTSTQKDRPSLTQDIETLIEKNFGFRVPVLIRTSQDFQTILKKMPTEWSNNLEEKTDIMFLWEAFDSKKTLDLITTTDVDTLIYVPGALIWHIAKKDYTKSAMRKFIGTEVYKNMTARNSNTVRKLAALLES